MLPQLSRKEAEKRRAEIALIVAEVELSKHLKEKLTAQQAGALINSLDQMPWSIEQIKRRGEMVKRTDTYGSIGFDRWFNVEPVYSRSEAYGIARELIAERKEQLKRLENISDEELVRRGLDEVKGVYLGLVNNKMDEITDQLYKRCKEAAAFIRAATHEGKAKIREILLTKLKKHDTKLADEILRLTGVREDRFAYVLDQLKEDPCWEQTLPFYAPFCLKEIEAMMKRVSGR